MISDPYFNTDRCVNRLLEVFHKYGTIIVGFDFDDTIFNYHDKEDFEYEKVIELLVKCSDMQFTMCLLTTKDYEWELDICKIYCEEQLDIRVDYVNYSPVFKWAAKPFVNILLDDKAGLGQAYEILNQTISKILEI